MSLLDLTRNSYQGGIPALKWVSLCKLFISKAQSPPPDGWEKTLSNSVLLLLPTYPGDPDLQLYLKRAIEQDLISVSVFVATFLQAARSNNLHVSSTLDMLCRVALEAHYSSGLPPIGSVVQFDESPIITLTTVSDSLALLRTAHTLQSTHFHPLSSSASELVILLLSSVGDISQVSTAQAIVYFAEVNDVLNNIRLSADVRQVIENYAVSLSLLLGDDAKAAREAQMMHSIQMALGKGEIIGPSSDTNIITCSLLLDHLITYRASEFGAGSGSDPVAYLIATYRWSSWTPSVFCSQLLQSAFISAAQAASSGSTSNALLWRAFVIGRLPHLLVTFIEVVDSENASKSDWRPALQAALSSNLRRSDLLAECDRTFTNPLEGGAEAEPTPSFGRDFLHQMVSLALVDQAFALSLDSKLANDSTHRMLVESQEFGSDLETFFDLRLSLENGLQDTEALIQRAWKDPSCHHAFASAVQKKEKRFTSLTHSFDVEPLSYLCKVLYTVDEALEIVSLQTRLSILIYQALQFIQDYDCESIGDPQTAMGHLGDVVLLVQLTLARYHINNEKLTNGTKMLSSGYLQQVSIVYLPESLQGEEASAFSSWFKALFDSSSEGIEDTILRATKPRTLLHICATLFSRAISANKEHKIDGDVLNNGVSYFMGPLLNWTLVGVIHALLNEIQQKGFAVTAPTHFEVLQALIKSPSIPKPVLRLCSSRVLKLLNDRSVQALGQSGKFDVENIRRVLSFGTTDLNGSVPANAAGMLPTPQTAWQAQPQEAIRRALSLSRAGKAPSLDVARCLYVLPPSKFLQLLWSELSVAATMGGLEACRGIATFVLVGPRSSGSPPLLPIFLHLVLPAIIARLDGQQPAENAINLELLVAVIFSALTAAVQLEFSLRTVVGPESKLALGQLTATMARRLAADLKAGTNSVTGTALLHRLASIQSFVANFPMFKSEA